MAYPVPTISPCRFCGRTPVPLVVGVVVWLSVVVVALVVASSVAGALWLPGRFRIWAYQRESASTRALQLLHHFGLYRPYGFSPVPRRRRLLRVRVFYTLHIPILWDHLRRLRRLIRTQRGHGLRTFDHKNPTTRTEFWARKDPLWSCFGDPYPSRLGARTCRC